jgi:hypothetical protein
MIDRVSRIFSFRGRFADQVLSEYSEVRLSWWQALRGPAAIALKAMVFWSIAFFPILVLVMTFTLVVWILLSGGFQGFKLDASLLLWPTLFSAPIVASIVSRSGKTGSSCPKHGGVLSPRRRLVVERRGWPSKCRRCRMTLRPIPRRPSDGARIP